LADWSAPRSTARRRRYSSSSISPRANRSASSRPGDGGDSADYGGGGAAGGWPLRPKQRTSATTPTITAPQDRIMLTVMSAYPQPLIPAQAG